MNCRQFADTSDDSRKQLCHGPAQRCVLRKATKECYARSAHGVVFVWKDTRYFIHFRGSRSPPLDITSGARKRQRLRDYVSHTTGFSLPVDTKFHVYATSASAVSFRE